MDIKDCFEERFLMSSEESRKKYEEYTKQVLENLAPKFVRKNKIPKLDYLPIPEKETLSTFNNEFFNFDSPIIQKEREKNKENRWIPCSERLPDKTGTYMTTVDYGKYGLATGQRFYHGKGLGWEDDCVIAWRPLPKPYKAERSDEE